MTILLDYSGGKLTGSAVSGAGAAGAIRYTGTPQYGKNTTPAEVASLHSAGREVHGVFEIGTSDFLGGYNAGVNNARALLADANHCGITGVLFMSADQHITTAQTPAWVQYVKGALTVLGSRLGVYGFAEAVLAVRSVAHYFWQAGAHPSTTGTASFVNVWQRNSGQTTMVVSGIQCDINDVLIPLGADVPLTDTDIQAVSDRVMSALISYRPVGPDGAVRSIYDSGYQARADAIAIAAAVKADAAAVQAVQTALAADTAIDQATQTALQADTIAIEGAVAAGPTAPAPVIDITALTNGIVAGLVPHLPPAADPVALAAAVKASIQAQFDKP